jgi:uncharacterized protein YdeI (YjbR/CyaY-like superfamily)
MNTLYVENRTQWRAWLEANSRAAKEVWLVYYKKGTGRPRVAYADAVEEAICFGWIDSKIRKLDQARFAQLFTPRKPQSRWSASNIARASRMIHEGKMTAAGLKVFNPGNKTPALPTKLPGPLEEQFRKQASAWENFQHFPAVYRRMTVGWVASAKREVTQLSRLRRLIAESEANKQIKFM